MITGSCLCGGVRFEIASFASDIYKCHCSRCRKQFGAACGTAAMAHAEGFRWTRGEDLIRRFRPEGSAYDTCFCQTCGSNVPLHLEAAHWYYVPMGLIDGSPGIPLTRHSHVDSKADWEILDDQIERLPGHLVL